MAYHLTRDALMLDLYAAYHCARQHKGGKEYVRRFASRLEQEIASLADDLWSRNYTPEPSSCFIVERPKKREVFAAQFRDRVVHHLYYNYTHALYERTFIEDTYSCISGRGTDRGIERLRKHIVACSDNYRRRCWVLSLDKRGYFMHINRKRLLELSLGTLEKMAGRTVGRHGARWCDVMDMDFVGWLTGEIVMLDPKENCRMAGDASDWEGLDRNKSLFYTADGCGLPIGNLTSQLLSNVYLNPFDQWMKREMHCKHFCRYVDDSRVVSCDREWLLGLVPQVAAFLKDELGLELHQGKVRMDEVHQGVEFLGAYIKPYRTYVSTASLERLRKNVCGISRTDKDRAARQVNSFLGVLGRYASYNLRAELFMTPAVLGAGMMDRELTRLTRPEEI